MRASTELRDLDRLGSSPTVVRAAPDGRARRKAESSDRPAQRDARNIERDIQDLISGVACMPLGMTALTRRGA